MKSNIPPLPHVGNGRHIQPGKPHNGTHKPRPAELDQELLELRGVFEAINKTQPVIEFDLAAETPAAAEAEVKAMCDKLLANTVIEGYRAEVA